MKHPYLLPVLFLLTINGWTSSRFFIRLNGNPVGTLIETRKVDRRAGIIQIRSVSRIRLQRGGASIQLSETTTEISRLTGTPLQFIEKADQAGLKVAYRVKFSGNYLLFHRDGEVKKQRIPRHTVLNFGSEKQIARFLKQKGKTVTFPVFSGDAMGVVNRTVRKLGWNRETGTWRLEVKDVSGKIELKQEMEVNEAGAPLYIKSRMMGVTIEFISDQAGTVQAEKLSRLKTGGTPDLLIQTLFHASQWFPSGVDVEAITLSVRSKMPGLTIPEGDFQSVSPLPHGLRVEIRRPVLHAGMMPDNVPLGLQSGPIVQSNLPEIRRIVCSLKGKKSDPVNFVRKVVRKVYRMIEKKDYGMGFANTASILKHREGDCTEHTVLAMAILRAGGIPCRAAVGVVSINGVIGYHMWPQISMDGKWISIDPTLDEVTADPSHLFMASSFLNDTAFQRDFLPIVRQLGGLSVTPLHVVFRNQAIFSRFGVWREGKSLAIGGTGCRFAPGGDFRWEPETKRDDSMEMYCLGTMILADGIRVSVSLADIKSRDSLTSQAKQMISDFSPFSFETILGHPVVLGRNSEGFAMAVECRGTLFRFTFSAPSATMKRELKEKAYDICLKLLANVKRTDSDR